MKRFLNFVVCLALFSGNVTSYAADTYDADTDTLSISLIKVSDTFYTNVKITLGTVVSLGCCCWHL